MRRKERKQICLTLSEVMLLDAKFLKVLLANRVSSVVKLVAFFVNVPSSAATLSAFVALIGLYGNENSKRHHGWDGNANRSNGVLLVNGGVDKLILQLWI